MPRTVVRGGMIVGSGGVSAGDVAMEDGRIVGLDLQGGEEIDARGLHVFPGVIDVHLHFNEPGRTHWEGAATGSRALAAGGGTLFFDMPLNSTPCTVNAREFDRKREALEAVSITDFGLWGGLVPESVREMPELAARGVIGFKAFLCDSGLPEFPRADDGTLFEGLQVASRLNLPVAVHAESHEITQALSRRASAEGRIGIRDFLDSRPVIAELEAIQRATLLAGEAKAKLHIVHVSCGRGVVLAAEARSRGVDVTIETCPHYLFFTEEDLERLGALTKCAPPLRDVSQQVALWHQVLDSVVDIVASDHSPAPPEMKLCEFHKAWGGVAGVQSTLAVLLQCGHFARGLSLERIASLLAEEPARRFSIAHKGVIAPDMDADLTLVDLGASTVLESGHLQQRHAISPYIGTKFRGVVQRTIRRGETIFHNGSVTATTQGKLVRPEQRN